ncbi:MAG: hypothetical protein HZA03_12065 [Nitrospinae bacterium]|nr:hypothetical protein [Nitrospinota bacterium]
MINGPKESGGRRYSLGIVILGLLAAVAAIVFFAANDFDRRAIHWGRMQAALLLTVPLLPGILLLAARRLRGMGIAYAAGIGTVAALVLALPIGLLILFFGVATPEQRVDALALAGYMLAMLGTAASAWFAHFRLPRDQRRHTVAALSLTGAALYALFGWGFFQKAVHKPYDRAALIREYNDRQARKTITAVADCARKYAGGGGRRGYPADMAGLFASGCLPRKLQRGQSNAAAGADEYAFYYYADPPDAGGKAGRFAACARAESEGAGTLVIGIDTDGNVTELGAPAWKPASTCFAAWAGNDDKHYLNALAGCLMSGVALRPGRGYPPSLFIEQGSHAGACDFRMIEIGGGGRMRTERGVIEYRPEPEAGGVISGYRLTLYPRGGGVALEMDHRGRVRELKLTNAAPTLDAIETMRPAEALKEEELNAKRRELKTACESGALSVCEDLGDFEWENSQPDAARRWWDFACERGRLQSCLLSSRYNPTTSPDEARGYKERCVQGETRYCQKLEELTRTLEPKIEELRRRSGFQSPNGAAARIERKR